MYLLVTSYGKMSSTKIAEKLISLDHDDVKTKYTNYTV